MDDLMNSDAGLDSRMFSSSLALIASSHTARCDSKYADPLVIEKLKRVRQAGCFELGEYLPEPFIKGIQPDYLDQATDDSVPVINTLAIRNLSVTQGDCKHIAREDFNDLSKDRRLVAGDVLLTVDGGVSIGKPCLFDMVGSYTIDSHVVVLRPQGLKPLALVYLLASAFGQCQFRRAESGASGQTTVTEDDVRRFIFPRKLLSTIDTVAARMEAERRRVVAARNVLDIEEARIWAQLEKGWY